MRNYSHLQEFLSVETIEIMEVVDAMTNDNASKLSNAERWEIASTIIATRNNKISSMHQFLNETVKG